MAPSSQRASHFAKRTRGEKAQPLEPSSVVQLRKVEVARTISPFVARVSYQPSCHWPFSRYPPVPTALLQILQMLEGEATV